MGPRSSVFVFQNTLRYFGKRRSKTRDRIFLSLSLSLSLLTWVHYTYKCMHTWVPGLQSSFSKTPWGILESEDRRPGIVSSYLSLSLSLSSRRCTTRTSAWGRLFLSLSLSLFLSLSPRGCTTRTSACTHSTWVPGLLSSFSKTPWGILENEDRKPGIVSSTHVRARTWSPVFVLRSSFSKHP